MPSKLVKTLALAAAALALGLLAGCGGSDDEDTAVVEGEPLELGSLLYNVQITRLLNPNSAEDGNYLDGLEPAPSGQDYLAVFMRITNEGDEPEQVPSSFTIGNSRGDTFESTDTDNPFALPLGSEIEPDDQLPALDTPPASGPIKGSMVLFLIDTAATENRPLELEIPGPDGETGTVELDI